MCWQVGFTPFIGHAGPGWVEVCIYSFQDLGTRRGWGSAPRAGRHYTRGRASTHCTGGWVGPRAGLDRCGKSRPHRDSIPDRPARSQSPYRPNYAAHYVLVTTPKFRVLAESTHSVYHGLEMQVFKSTHNFTIHQNSYMFRLPFCIHHQGDPKICIITFHIPGISLMNATKQ